MQKLEREGFKDIQVSAHAPDADFPEHRHDLATAHVVLEGELTITDATGTRTVHPGERFDVSAGTVHAARCGPGGCTFLMGVKDA